MTARSSGDFAAFQRHILGGLALLLASLSVQIWLIGRVRTALEAASHYTIVQGNLPTPQVPNYTIFLVAATVMAVLGAAIALTGFFRGMATARRVGEHAGLTGYSYGVGWTAASFFVPLLNLYRPWVGLAETRRSIFVAVENRQMGKRWNKFGDFSFATIALAIVFLGSAGGEIVYLIFTQLPTPTGPAQADAALAHVRNQILVTIGFFALQGAALFVYLATLARPVQRLRALVTEGALSLPS